MRPTIQLLTALGGQFKWGPPSTQSGRAKRLDDNHEEATSLDGSHVCYMRIQYTKTAKGDYTYVTSVNASGPSLEKVEEAVITLSRDADIIARAEIAQRLRLDRGGA